MHAIIIPQGRGKRGENVKSQLTTEIQKQGILIMLAEDEGMFEAFKRKMDRKNR